MTPLEVPPQISLVEVHKEQLTHNRTLTVNVDLEGANAQNITFHGRPTVDTSLTLSVRDFELLTNLVTNKIAAANENADTAILQTARHPLESGLDLIVEIHGHGRDLLICLHEGALDHNAYGFSLRTWTNITSKIRRVSKPHQTI